MPQKIDKKVLIVEDDEDFVFILKIKFESEGFSVVTAGDGEGAVDTAKQEKPDLILSDILLPKMNGVEMAKKIKEANKDVKIVFLSNLTDTEYTSEVKKMGFTYLVKSDLKISDIVERVKKELNQ